MQASFLILRTHLENADQQRPSPLLDKFVLFAEKWRCRLITEEVSKSQLNLTRVSYGGLRYFSCEMAKTCGQSSPLGGLSSLGVMQGLISFG
jgi:hypothetical protein